MRYRGSWKHLPARREEDHMTQVESVHAGRANALDRLAMDPPVDTLVGLLANQALRAPDHEFLRFAARSWTFGEIDEWTSRLARRLITEDGVRPGDRIAIM